jgi:hypothetical protein
MPIGIPQVPLARRWFGRGTPNERAVRIQPAPKDNELKRGYPRPLAARGPDWSVGVGGYQTWHPSVLRQGTALVTRGNYGLTGRPITVRDDPKGGSPYYGRVRPVNWDRLVYPTFIPYLPAWNNLPKGALYNMQIHSVNRSANHNVSRQPYNIGKPLHYDQARPARLMAGVN